MVLTIFHAVECFSPIDGNIEEGFKVLDELFGKILQGTNLPNNDEWIENLEINNELIESVESKDFLDS